ncbi:VRR-NUC domain-containing protein [Sporosarcina trichiuri]|uniref:VRR-NUC domain-containing protein n=1 Tax=Sporosarcina trichiuri TaxID=3056445 RepID=UPI0025B3B757|nr:VRR-NUC domain-containing protein [Sporosarcina sp. 0.2-SM1T-5]WJY27461.1 VRR-NUC domain-containing protein [Sporosarcina sp. 0.2-SM1T-5]
MLEKELERKFVEMVKAEGGLALKFTSPNMAGVPDRIVLLPDGVFFFAELKRPGQKLRPLQLKRKEQLEQLGFRVAVVDSVESVARVRHTIRGGDAAYD